MPEIQGRCEQAVAGTALQSESYLERALSLTRGHRDSGDKAKLFFFWQGSGAETAEGGYGGRLDKED